MLRRQVCSGFVCLRCRLQQANTVNRPGAVLFQRVASKEFSPISTIYSQRLLQCGTRKLYSTSRALNDQEADHSSSLQDAVDPNASHAVPETPEPTKEYIPLVEEKSLIEGVEKKKKRGRPKKQTQEVEERKEASDRREPVPQDNEDDTPIKEEPRYKAALVSSLRPFNTMRPFYHARGKKFLVERESFEGEMLGKPASAIVMRAGGKSETRRKTSKGIVFMEPSDLLPAQIPLAQQLEQESREPGIDEILENIDELRPSERTLVEAEFLALRDNLEQGFTTAQLTAYLARSREDPSENVHPARFSTDPDWVRERQPWIAAVEDPDLSLEPLLYGYASNSSTIKQRISTRVLRECWGISTYEVLDQDGYLSVKLRKDEFTLLHLGHKRWLTAIAQASPDPGTQIVISPSIETISILGKHKTTEFMLSEINKALEGARTTSFDANLLSPEALEPVVLEEVGNITDTVVRLDESGQQVLVTWIHAPNRPAELENPADVVLRYLLYPAGTGPRASSSFAVVPESDKRRGRYVAEQGYEKKMSWMERLHKWARYIKPATEATADPVPPQAFELSPSLLPRPLEIENRNEMRFYRHPSPSLKKLGAVQGWPSKTTTDTRAVFGHVLHAGRAGYRAPLVSKTTALEDSRRRAFLPVHPPLRSIKFENNLFESGLYHAILVLRFVPAPVQTSVAPVLAASAPPLELRIEIDHKEVKRIVSLRAVVGTHTSDVALPSYPVDVRLVQTTYAELTGRSLDEYAVPVLDYLDRSEIRPWDGQLDNPSMLEGVELPDHLFLQRDTKNSSIEEKDTNPSDKPVQETLPDQPATEEEQEPNKDLETTKEGEEEKEESEIHNHKIDYLFVSREIQRVISAEVDGYKVLFWNIDSGKRGGQTTQLSLDAICPKQDKVQGRADFYKQPETFLKVASQMASGVNGFQWLGNSPDKYVHHL